MTSEAIKRWETRARLHVAMLNSFSAIDMLGGGDLKIVQIDGQFSREIMHEVLPHSATVLRSHFQGMREMYSARWKAKGDMEAITVSEVLKELEKDGCPDLFIKSMTVIVPWTVYSEQLGKPKEINLPFVFHPHPFKPSVFNRLKGRMPSFPLYARMKELRKILSTELDDETKKRWRDILLINYPHEKISNQEMRVIWANEPYCILLKESKGRFTFMEVAESREVSG